MWKLGVVSNQRKGIILANKIILGPVAILYLLFDCLKAILSH